jgi:hypothetical protein
VGNKLCVGVVTLSLKDLKKNITMNIKNKTYFEQTAQERVPTIDDPNVVIEKEDRIRDHVVIPENKRM